MGGLDKVEDRRLQCLVLLVFKIVLLGSVLLSCSVNESFKGTEFKPPKVAPDFELTDQFGQSVRLSDFRGTMKFIEECAPKQVYTVHGSTKELAKQVERKLGISAKPLPKYGEVSIESFT